MFLQYTWAAFNIPEKPAQVKSMSGTHWVSLLSEIFHPRHAASRVDNHCLYYYGLYVVFIFSYSEMILAYWVDFDFFWDFDSPNLWSSSQSQDRSAWKQ